MAYPTEILAKMPPVDLRPYGTTAKGALPILFYHWRRVAPKAGSIRPPRVLPANCMANVPLGRPIPSLYRFHPAGLWIPPLGLDIIYHGRLTNKPSMAGSGGLARTIPRLPSGYLIAMFPRHRYRRSANLTSKLNTLPVPCISVPR